jgi:hypothetical protein
VEERRAKYAAAPLSALYADGDGAKVPEGFPEPSIVVESSPGREQFYWLLTEPVAPEVGERLNRRLSHAMGADMSGWDLTQLLRPPGSRNHKWKGEPTVVLRETTGELHDPEELNRLLPELPEVTASLDGELPEPASPPMEDDEVLEKIRTSRKAERFERL